MKPVLVGFTQSSYTITARAVASYKGVAIDFQPIAPGEHRQPAHLAQHPWGKVPVLHHEGSTLFETAAIAVYLDEAFDGPSLQPSTPLARARMWQWISATACYLYPHLVPGYILRYAFAGPDGPDRTAIEQGLPALERDVRVIAESLGRSTYLVDDTLTLADLFVAPLLMGIAQFPEGRDILERHPALASVARTFGTDERFTRVLPPPPA